MQFRPCIDIHNGKVKQIVGSSLVDEGNQASENFVAEQDAAFFADLYKERNICGGHVILLNKEGSEFFDETRRQAVLALRAYPGGLQVGGGITAENASYYIEQGASHVVVTSYVFSQGKINYVNLNKLVDAVGPEHVVLDLSCKKYEDGYYVMTDRWQNKTDMKLTVAAMEELSSYCDEFLIHAVDVEGKSQGIEEELVRMLGEFTMRPVTYAGGVHDFEDLAKLKDLGQNHVHVTIGSALDLFGGTMEFERVLKEIEA
ncbi:MAG: phosphoribosylformimino-5-aminoimidazole carboxamide ribotide isomerase [Lachnospiraceae bacterium]|nr:phosphoribosylformimino-5-aminoimidazole carboxamide ribotide isomerase [Lachnospiraceae bacterium]